MGSPTEHLTEHKRSFKNGLQLAWDGTSLELAQTCLRKYYYTMIRGIKPKRTSVHLIFGGIYASALEDFYKYRAEGQDTDSALRQVVREAMIASWDYSLDADGEPIPGSGHPTAFDDVKKTRPNLIRTIIWYVEQFGVEVEGAMSTHHLQSGKPAVELSFTLEFDEEILYCGHLDRVVDMGGQLMVMDQKAQPLTSKVLTLRGWTAIGDLTAGTLVATIDGSFVPVTALHPKGVTKTYRVTFNDKTAVLCAEDHLWQVGTNLSNVAKTVPLTDMLATDSQTKYWVPLCEPIQHQTASLPLSPYLLGTLLGDGYLNGNSIQLSSTKKWLIDAVREELPEGDVIKKASEFNNSWTISGGATLAAIRQLGLKGKKSYTKFVPSVYLYADEEQRRALLQGLLDTDGSWNGKSRIYDSCSIKLIKAICELTRSLGGTARYRDRGDVAWRASLRLPDFPTGVGRRYITSIIRDEDAETMCIEVDHPSHLYVTENHTVTHNTTGGTVGTYYFDQFKPNNQMSGYTWAGQIILHAPVKGVIIDAAQIAVNFTRFERGITTRTKDELAEWHESSAFTIKLAREQTVKNEWPMNLSACGNYGGCPFRTLCSRSPSVRENFIKADYNEHNWDPLKAR